MTFKCTVFSILLLVSTSIFAQETHTPAYECISESDTSAKNYFILIGNKFSEDLDWSGEVILTTQKDYARGAVEMSDVHLFEHLDYENNFFTAKNPYNSSMSMDSNLILKQTKNEEQTSYQCTKTNWYRL